MLTEVVKRIKQLTAHAPEQWRKECACEWLVSNCAHWNELTYRRRQEYFDPDGDVWNAETNDLYDKYGATSGTGAAQQLKQKNDDVWDAFFENLNDYHNGKLEDKPSPPGYWGNREDGYDLRGIVRNDQYSFTWRKDGSTFEFTVGRTSRRSTTCRRTNSDSKYVGNHGGVVRSLG